MTMTADEIIERRQTRRRLGFWRVAAFLAIAAFILAAAAAGGAFSAFSEKSRQHIARVKIEGFISDDRKMLELLAELGKKDQVKAVILDIASPGGSTIGGEAMYEAVRELSAGKPVVASVGTLAASAAYMIACASDQIVARHSSIVGSIGVLFQYGDVSAMLDKLGVKVDAIKSAPLKAEPSPFHPATEEAKQMIGRIVTDSYDWFVDLVSERRKLGRARTLQLADGSIFTGSQGLANGLVDRLGGEAAAKAWLVEAKSIDKDLRIVEWKPKNDDSGLFGTPAGAAELVRLLGNPVDALQSPQLRGFISRRLFLDGLMSVMQGSLGM